MMTAETATPSGRIRWTAWPLAMQWASATGFTATVRASVLAYLGMLALVGITFLSATRLIQDGTLPASTEWPTILVFVALIMLGGVVHEAGHVAGYRITGLRWTGATVKFGASVQSKGQTTSSQQILVSALGPVCETLAGLSLLAIADMGSIVWLSGLYLGANGATGLVFPWPSNSDAAKMYCHTWLIVKQRLLPQRKDVH